MALTGMGSPIRTLELTTGPSTSLHEALYDGAEFLLLRACGSGCEVCLSRRDMISDRHECHKFPGWFGLRNRTRGKR